MPTQPLSSEKPFRRPDHEEKPEVKEPAGQVLSTDREGTQATEIETSRWEKLA
jgi:hypothetical protein